MSNCRPVRAQGRAPGTRRFLARPQLRARRCDSTQELLSAKSVPTPKGASLAVMSSWPLSRQPLLWVASLK